MFSLTIVLLVLATIVYASPITTGSGINAQRLARGLSPLPPKVRAVLPRGVYDPTPIFAAKRSSPSSKPGFTFTGRVQVRKTNGEVIGFLWSAFGVGSDSLDKINFAGSDTPDLQVSFSASSATSPSGPFDIRTTNPDNPNFPFAPFVGIDDFLNQGIAPGSPNGLILTNVLQTSPGSPPVNNEESAIWFFDPMPKQLTAQFINPNGFQPAEPTTIFAFSPVVNRVSVVGDLAAWNTANPTLLAIEVFLFLV